MRSRNAAVSNMNLLLIGWEEPLWCLVSCFTTTQAANAKQTKVRDRQVRDMWQTDRWEIDRQVTDRWGTCDRQTGDRQVRSGSAGHSELLQVIHEHLQTDVVGQDWSSRLLQRSTYYIIVHQHQRWLQVKVTHSPDPRRTCCCGSATGSLWTAGSGPGGPHHHHHHHNHHIIVYIYWIMVYILM